MYIYEETYNTERYKGVNNMKFYKILIAFLLMSTTLFGCSKGTDKKESKYADALTVLQEARNAYSEEERFSIAGGDMEHAVMDAPGKFDISKKEELISVLHISETMFNDIEDCATMVHMMNANTFSAGAFRLKDGSDVNRFADDWINELSNVQWMCGQPETLLIVQVDDQYVIVAYGIDELIQVFKKNVQTLNNASVLSEKPIAQ